MHRLQSLFQVKRYAVGCKYPIERALFGVNLLFLERLATISLGDCVNPIPCCARSVSSFATIS